MRSPTKTAMPVLTTESAVSARYSSAAEQRESELCCPVDYDARHLEVIPQEVIERDYGCGDPSKYLRPGETVLDLGSGGGKICFIAAQVVGASGKVIGVDMNDSMLELARRSQPAVAKKVGFDNVVFRKGKIQDLAIDRDRVDGYLSESPIRCESDLRRFEDFITRLRTDEPMIASDTIDVVVSNCVLNLVDPNDKAKMFRELHRVLKPGGRAVISDIVSDEPVPEHLKQDPELWSGCVSGAFQEREFLLAFESAGFYGMQVLELQQQPWRTVQGIEFRSVTVVAFKGADGPCMEHNEAVIYRGPFRKVLDDDGHHFVRGERTAVCRKTFEVLTRGQYADHFIPIEPREPISPEEASPFECNGPIRKRLPSETKGDGWRATTGDPAGCGPCC